MEGFICRCLKINENCQQRPSDCPDGNYSDEWRRVRCFSGIPFRGFLTRDPFRQKLPSVPRAQSDMR